MNLVMFDIDGTLTATTGIDEVCFIQAVQEVLGVKEIDTDLLNYTHVTDEGITSEIIEHHAGRPAGREELSDIRNLFVKLLKEKPLSHPAAFQPIAGASDILNQLGGLKHGAVSLATGGWKKSARLKLEVFDAGIQKIPMATSSDAVSRQEIMQLSEERARTACRIQAFDSVAFVGDGLWDLRSASALGYGFVGIGKGDRAVQLTKEGARHVFPDYTDRRRFIQTIEKLWAAGRPPGQ